LAEVAAVAVVWETAVGKKREEKITMEEGAPPLLGGFAAIAQATYQSPPPPLPPLPPLPPNTSVEINSGGGGGGPGDDDGDAVVAAIASAIAFFVVVVAFLFWLLRRTTAALAAAASNGDGLRADASEPPDNLVLVYTSKNNLLEGAERMDQLCFDEEFEDIGRIV